MNNSELIVALFAIGFIGALAAFFVMWSFYDEQKKLTKEERERRWDEISRAAGLENELERSKAREKCSAEVVLWHNKQVALYGQKNKALQDRLSSIICPTNNHVWKDGVCVKCGRAKDG